jgi:hypothetical protein
MKNFDAERLALTERDRSFQIGGREFTYRVGVRPEVLARYFDGSPTGDNMETIQIYDETIVAFLDPDVPGQEEAWKAVRAVEGKDAITLADIRTLIEWLIGEQAARPTGPLSDSSNGSGSPTSGTVSTADSVSPEGAASTA